MDIESLLKDFIQVCQLSNVTITREEIQLVTLKSGASHVTRPLQKGYMAVYIFEFGEQCLKVGKVGINSNARYQSQHYNPDSAKSNLAKSILDDYDINNKIGPQNDIGTWIKNNTTRTDLLIHGSKNIRVLNLLESFIQCRLKPKYEGYKSQRE